MPLISNWAFRDYGGREFRGSHSAEGSYNSNASHLSCVFSIDSAARFKYLLFHVTQYGVMVSSFASSHCMVVGSLLLDCTQVWQTYNTDSSRSRVDKYSTRLARHKARQSSNKGLTKVNARDACACPSEREQNVGSCGLSHLESGYSFRVSA